MKILLPTQYDSVANAVCGHLDVTRDEIESDLQTIRIATARRLTWYLLKTLTGCNLSEIARHTGNVPSAISIGVSGICDLIATDAKFAQAVSVIESRCKLILEAK